MATSKEQYTNSQWHPDAGRFAFKAAFPILHETKTLPEIEIKTVLIGVVTFFLQFSYLIRKVSV